MGARAAQATDIFAALTRAPALRTDTPKTIGSELPGEQASVDPPTDHQNAVIALADYIDPTPGLTPQERADRFFGGVVIPEAP